MQDYVDAFEKIFNRLSPMKSDIAEDMQVAMVLASFGDRNGSPFGYFIASLQSIQGNLACEKVTASLLQEYEEHFHRSRRTKGRWEVHKAQALAAPRRRDSFHHRQNNSKSRTEKGRCFEWREVGLLAKDYPMKYGKNSFVRRQVGVSCEAGRHMET